MAGPFGLITGRPPAYSVLRLRPPQQTVVLAAVDQHDAIVPGLFPALRLIVSDTGRHSSCATPYGGFDVTRPCRQLGRSAICRASGVTNRATLKIH